MKRYVILDCDMGVKDVWALMVLLKGQTVEDSGPHQTGYELKAVTTVYGYSTMENCTENTIRVLNALERSDILVYKGCEAPLFPCDEARRKKDEDACRDEIVENWDAGLEKGLTNWQHVPAPRHPNPGFGQIEDPPELDASMLSNEHAVNVMFKLVDAHPGLVDFICTGPLTNLATCMMLYGSEFIDKMGSVYALGGNYSVKQQYAEKIEFNFKCDPEAAHIVISRVTNYITILPMETHHFSDFDILTQSYRYSVLAAKTPKLMALLNRVERFCELPRQRRKWYSADAILASHYVYNRQSTKLMVVDNFTIELGAASRGRLVRDFHPTEHNANCIIFFRILTYIEALQFTVGIRSKQPDDHTAAYERDEMLMEYTMDEEFNKLVIEYFASGN